MQKKILEELKPKKSGYESRIEKDYDKYNKKARIYQIISSMAYIFVALIAIYIHLKDPWTIKQIIFSIIAIVACYYAPDIYNLARFYLIWNLDERNLERNLNSIWKSGGIIEITGTQDCGKEILLNVIIREMKGIKFANFPNTIRDCNRIEIKDLIDTYRLSITEYKGLDFEAQPKGIYKFDVIPQNAVIIIDDLAKSFDPAKLKKEGINEEEIKSFFEWFYKTIDNKFKIFYAIDDDEVERIKPYIKHTLIANRSLKIEILKKYDYCTIKGKTYCYLVIKEVDKLNEEIVHIPYEKWIEKTIDYSWKENHTYARNAMKTIIDKIEATNLVKMAGSYRLTREERIDLASNYQLFLKKNHPNLMNAIMPQEIKFNDGFHQWLKENYDEETNAEKIKRLTKEKNELLASRINNFYDERLIEERSEQIEIEIKEIKNKEKEEVKMKEGNKKIEEEVK